MVSSALTPGIVNGVFSVRRFWVSVPVLSEHSTSTPAISSMAANRLTTACLAARMRAPTAMVTDKTVGMATGMAATVSTSTNCSTVSSGSPRSAAAIRMTTASAAARTIR